MNNRLFEGGDSQAYLFNPAIDMDGSEVFVIHAGYARSPKELFALTDSLAQETDLPILGVDTRFGRPGVDIETYFPGSTSNTDVLRATQLVDVLERNEIEIVHFIGHSTGAMVGIQAAEANDTGFSIASMTLVNGVGTGKMNPLGGMMRAGTSAAQEISDLAVDTRQAAQSTISSALRILANPVAALREIQHMDAFDSWETINKLVNSGVAIHVLGGSHDPIIDARDMQENHLNAAHAQLTIEILDGNHSMIYRRDTARSIAQHALAAKEQSLTIESTS